MMATITKKFAWSDINIDYRDHVYMTLDNSIINKPRKKTLHPPVPTNEIEDIRAKLNFLYNATYQSLKTSTIASLRSSLTSLAKSIPPNNQKPLQRQIPLRVKEARNLPLYITRKNNVTTKRPSINCDHNYSRIDEGKNPDNYSMLMLKKFYHIFRCDQQLINEWYFPSVCLSVTTFWQCSHHRIVMKFSGVITNDKSDVHAKGQGQRSKVKVTEAITQLSRFWTVTPVLIHQWLWNDAESLKQHKRGALLFFKVIRQIWRSHQTKNRWFWPELSISGL